ncbi:MAG: hypothetical protein EHM36_11380 [Deltaproteobacteria bacterium]|nr:MAG: hypothetical protein EHM36_11380 [Deltaproteobacteria bacterium]
MALDIGAFMPVEAFKNRVDRMIDELKSSPPMEGSSGIFMPGEIEYLKERDYLQNGIPVAGEVLGTLDNFAKKIGIPKLSY